jgi:hypothetical protein
MKLFLTIVFIVFIKITYSQSLIPNGSFELYSSCPTNYSQIDSALFWINPSTNLPNTGSPDYYNQCGSLLVHVPNYVLGFQNAKTGVAYAGIYLWASNDSVREYIEVPLNKNLIANECYYFEMFVNLTNICTHTTDDIGVYFSDSLVFNINNYYPLPFVPQIQNIPGNYLDTVNWLKIDGYYNASGGESHIIIGNFNSDLNTTTIDTNILGIDDFIYVLIDDVSLVHCPLGIEYLEIENQLKIYPNPFTNIIQLSSDSEIEQLYIFDLSGKLIFNTDLFDINIEIDLSFLENGFYFLKGLGKNGTTLNKIIKY